MNNKLKQEIKDKINKYEPEGLSNLTGFNLEKDNFLSEIDNRERVISLLDFSTANLMSLNKSFQNEKLDCDRGDLIGRIELYNKANFILINEILMNGRDRARKC